MKNSFVCWLLDEQLNYSTVRQWVGSIVILYLLHIVILSFIKMAVPCILTRARCISTIYTRLCKRK